MLKVKRVEKGRYRAEYKGNCVEFNHLQAPENGKPAGWYGLVNGATKVIEDTMREAIWVTKLIMIDETQSTYTVMDRTGRDIVVVHAYGTADHNLEVEAL